MRWNYASSLGRFGEDYRRPDGMVTRNVQSFYLSSYLIPLILCAVGASRWVINCIQISHFEKAN